MRSYEKNVSYKKRLRTTGPVRTYGAPGLYPDPPHPLAGPGHDPDSRSRRFRRPTERYGTFRLVRRLPGPRRHAVRLISGVSDNRLESVRSFRKYIVFVRFAAVRGFVGIFFFFFFFLKFLKP
uniref:Uncharacterized protein n=1 Tax=Sipha flava TaxID=143950 RepID=A0A2S2Q156_9HEMI